MIKIKQQDLFLDLLLKLNQLHLNSNRLHNTMVSVTDALVNTSNQYIPYYNTMNSNSSVMVPPNTVVKKKNTQEYQLEENQLFSKM